MTPAQDPTERIHFLSRLGLGRPETRAWAMYDWAVSAVQTTLMVAVFPIYFKQVAAAGVPDATSTAYVATANSGALGVVAVLSPVLGAWADFAGKR
jgi:UMF1 family MFS transporter